MKPLSQSTAIAVTLSPLLAQSQTIPNSETGPAHLNPYVVTSLTISEQDSLEAAQERVAEQPGGASIVTPEDWTGRTIAPEEIFQFDPGVFARSRGVGNDTRLSVRGSGLQRQFGDRGVTLLLDGIPANDADGSFYFRTIDPFSISHIETFRGANGLPFGGNQLGGAINIVQRNGLNTPGGRLQLEYGRHDTFRSHISYGGSDKHWDYYLGYSYGESDGYRGRQGSDNFNINANVGYHWDKNAVTRFYFLFSESDAELSGSLTRDEFLTNPRQAGSNRTDAADRDLKTIRFGQRTEWNTQNGQWSFYTNYQYLDFDHLINEGLFRFNRLIDYNSHDFQVGVHGEEEWTFHGLQNTARIDTRFNYGFQDEDGFTGFVTPGRSSSNIDRDNIATNFQLYVQNDTTFADRHHLILGAGLVYNRREVDIGSGDETGDLSGTINDTGLVYRIGYLYEPNDQVQLFANFSQSFEGSPFSEVGTSLNPSFDELDPQIAQTFEIGTRFENSWANGELVLYQSFVNDEFIDEEIALGVTTTTNLDAIHRGIEAALTVDVTEIAGIESGPQLFFDQSYQYNDFEIDEGNNNGNRLPGVSEHVYSGRVRVQDRSQRWKAALSAEWLPEGFVVNNENTLSTAGFVNWRLSGEVKVHEGVSLYGGIDNLFDRRFVNTVSINPAGNAFIDPANGRAAYVGMKFKW